jgi:hypothetical protein
VYDQLLIAAQPLETQIRIYPARRAVVSFKFTKLREGEQVVFGPVTTTRSTSVSASGGTGQGSLTSSSGRTVGVTSLRVIAEDLSSADKTLIISNAEVQRVAIKRQQRQGQSSITLVSATATNGQTIKLGIKGLPAQSEAVLAETFANAEVFESKGGSGKVVLIIAIVIGAVVVLACVVPMLIPLILRLFGGG